MRRGVLRNHKRCFLRQGLNGRGRCLSPRHGDHGESGCIPRGSLCLGESARFVDQCHFTKRMLRQHRGPSRQGTRSGGAALGGGSRALGFRPARTTVETAICDRRNTSSGRHRRSQTAATNR
jgi:hypothetical protein